MLLFLFLLFLQSLYLYSIFLREKEKKWKHYILKMRLLTLVFGCLKLPQSNRLSKTCRCKCYGCGIFILVSVQRGICTLTHTLRVYYIYQIVAWVSLLFCSQSKAVVGLKQRTGRGWTLRFLYVAMKNYL